MRSPAQFLTIALMAAAVAGCTKAQARVPGPMALDVPPPPARVAIPVILPEPEEPPPPAPPPAAPVAMPSRPSPPRTAGTTPATTPTPPPVSEAPAAPPPAVLQTNVNAGVAQQRTNSLITAVERDLGRVNVRGLSADAREQLNRAQSFIKLAKQALEIQNYSYAEAVAEKARLLAAELVKG